MDKPICFIIPAYNEAGTVATIVRRTLEAYPDSEVVVVNDGSTDHTAWQARLAGAVVIDLPFNSGYGTALHTGLTWAVRRGAEYAVTLDADGQHDPAEVSRILEPIQSGRADIALGSRYLGDSCKYRVPLARRLGSRLFARTITTLTGQRLTDPTTGFQCLDARALRVIVAMQDFPEKCPDADLILYAHYHGLRIEEVGVAMYADETGDSMHGFWKSLFYTPKMLAAIMGVVLGRSK